MSEAVAAIVARCEQLIDDIDLPSPFHLDTLCDRLGQMWGSIVCVYPLPLPPNGPCGMWASIQITGQVYDLFAVEADAPPWHQAMILFHEVGHRLAGHPGTTGLSVDMRALLATLLPTLDPELINRTLGCGREPTAYDDLRETEAEYIGTRLLDRVIGWGSGPLAHDAPADLLRLHAALDTTTRARADG